jgi:hypothetical protein
LQTEVCQKIALRALFRTSVWFVAFGAFETFASFEILLVCLRTALLGPHSSAGFCEVCTRVGKSSMNSYTGGKQKAETSGVCGICFFLFFSRHIGKNAVPRR